MKPPGTERDRNGKSGKTRFPEITPSSCATLIQWGFRAEPVGDPFEFGIVGSLRHKLTICHDRAVRYDSRRRGVAAMNKALPGVIVLLLLMTIRAFAHHAFSVEYDENRRVAVT